MAVYFYIKLRVKLDTENNHMLVVVLNMWLVGGGDKRGSIDHILCCRYALCVVFY